MLLLADPRIDSNKPRDNGATPFFIACQKGHKEVVLLLLTDPRIDPNKPWTDQGTPLWCASQEGHLVVVQHLLASGKEIDTKRRSNIKNRTAAEQGRAMGSRTKRVKDTDEDYQRKNPMAPFAPTLLMNTSVTQWL